MSRRIALLIGNGAFPREPELAPLAGPANDVRHLAQVLESPALGAFDEVKTFVDAEHHAIAPELEETLAEAAPDATVLIYYSGHGKLNSRGQLCLATVNTRLSQLHSTSLPLPTLKTLIDESRCRQVLLILDCCFSGAAGKAFLRGTVDDQLLLSAQESSGLHILSSSTGLEVSRERENEAGGEVMGNFTRCLVEGIRTGDADANGDGVITVSELREYVGRNLRGQSPRYWGIEAGGDPPVARNANSLRERQAREQREREEAALRRVAAAQKRLTGWLNAGHLPADVYARALDCLEPPGEGDPPPPLARDRLLELIEGPAASPRHLVTAFRALDVLDGDAISVDERRDEREPPAKPAPPPNARSRPGDDGRAVDPAIPGGPLVDGSTAGGSTSTRPAAGTPAAGASTVHRSTADGSAGGESTTGRSTFSTWQTSGSPAAGAKNVGSKPAAAGANGSTMKDTRLQRAASIVAGVLVAFVVLLLAVESWLQREQYYDDAATTADTTTVYGGDTMSVAVPVPTDTAAAPTTTTSDPYWADSAAAGTDTVAGYYGDTTAM